jgi:Trk K+ transport system NAD-binding subunit
VRRLREAVLVEDQRGVGATSLDQRFLQRAGIADAPLVFGVVGDAPAASVDAVVALAELRKGFPGGRVERTGRNEPRSLVFAPSAI